MLGLITDRTQSNVDRLNALAQKGWNAMTEEERAEWTGNILTPQLAGHTEPVNLLPNNNFYSSGVDVKFKNREVVATAKRDGTYLYAVLVVGNASDFERKILTLSVDSVVLSGNSTALIAAYWHNASGYESAGASLAGAGSVTFYTGANTGNREYLALYIYVSASVQVKTGDSVIYKGVMLESGSERHPYVPYTPTLPTSARKGAYNYSDLNRVELAVAELSEELGLSLVTKTDWREWDIPKQADMDRFLSNIQAIRAFGNPLATTPSAPGSMQGLSHKEANDIEKILNDIDISVSTLFRCGELFSGEV